MDVAVNETTTKGEKRFWSESEEYLGKRHTLLLEKVVGFAVIIASGASLIGIKMLELPIVITLVLSVGATALCLCGIVVLFAEKPLGFLRARERKAVKYDR